MSEHDIKMLYEKHNKLETKIDNLIAIITELRDANIRNEQKRYECQEQFDNRYLLNAEFGRYFYREWDTIKKAGRGTFSYIKDWIMVANTIVLLWLVLGGN